MWRNSGAGKRKRSRSRNNAPFSAPRLHGNSKRRRSRSADDSDEGVGGFDLDLRMRQIVDACMQSRSDIARDQEVIKARKLAIDSQLHRVSEDSHFSNVHFRYFLGDSDSARDLVANRMMDKWRRVVESEQYKLLKEKRETLPIYAMKDELLSGIDSNPFIVVCGETGCGKSTQLPQILMEHLIKSRVGPFKIVCTQPRRICASSLAERVASEIGEDVGGLVGSQIRFESKVSQDTALLYCTIGIVLQFLHWDSSLSNISHIFIDEVHERSIETDFLIQILKRLVYSGIRPDLKVVIMSATINAKFFSEYLENCPIFEIPGSCHPVRQIFIEEAYQIVYKRSFQQMFWNPLHIIAGDILRILLYIDEQNAEKDQRNGAIIVFLPGWQDISKVSKALNDNIFCRKKFFVLHLHGQLSSSEQQKVFTTPPPNHRKVILSTNIAETSLTIEDVVYVIDCGVFKEIAQTASGINALNAKTISKTSVMQRKGRAGRVRPGECWHLFPESFMSEMEESQSPEIQRLSLHHICLRIKSLGIEKNTKTSLRTFLAEGLSAPSSESIESGIEQLKSLSLLKDDESITPLGYFLSKLAIDCKIGKVLVCSVLFGCADSILKIVAMLSCSRSPFSLSSGNEKHVKRTHQKLAFQSNSDHYALWKVYESYEEAKANKREDEFCAEKYLSKDVLEDAINLKKHYLKQLIDSGLMEYDEFEKMHGKVPDWSLVKSILVCGLYPNISFRNCHIEKSALSKYGECYASPSALSNFDGYDYSFSIFNGIIQSNNRKLVFDLSHTTIYPILIFGSLEDIREDENWKGYVSLEGFLRIHMPKGFADFLKTLTNSYDEIVEFRIQRPGVALPKNCQNLLSLISRFLVSHDKREMDCSYDFIRFEIEPTRLQ
jgi:ATP-dependent RNA helicase DHX36